MEYLINMLKDSHDRGFGPSPSPVSTQIFMLMLLTTKHANK